MNEIVRIENRGGELYADSRQVAQVLGIEHKNVLELIRKNGDDFQRVAFETLPLETAGGVQSTTVAFLPETECLLLITYVRNTEEAKVAKRALITAFQAMHKRLEQIAQSGHTSRPLITEWDKAREVVEWSASMLRMDDSSKVALMRKACEKHSMPTDLLPDYTQGEAVLSATALLKENGASMGTIMFNKKMQDAGLLEKKTRQSKSKGSAEFWSLTEKGLVYGKNMVSDQNRRETQPLYYVSKFPELLKVVHA